MQTRGIHHVGHYTRDFDATLDFYVGTLGFEVRRADIVNVFEGGRVRHVFLEMGDSEFLAVHGTRGGGRRRAPAGGRHDHPPHRLRGGRSRGAQRPAAIACSPRGSRSAPSSSTTGASRSTSTTRSIASGWRLARRRGKLDENDARIQERFSVHAAQVQEPAASRATYHA